MERFFKRKIYDRMLDWKHSRNGKTALLIEGARRVGKSTIVEQFARQEYESYILIDFNQASQEVKSLFDDLMDLNFIFLRLQTLYHVSLVERNSLIVFDEVQWCPRARQAIKYLVADGRYDYIETGSLISIKKNTSSITIPSEEQRLTMYPMDYEEFRWALGDNVTMPLLQTFMDKKVPLGPAHRAAMRDVRLYMLVGGMPQAVNEYLDTNDLSKVDVVKRDIIRLYQDDFRKIDVSGHVERLFMQIPSQLSKNVNRYQPYQVLGNVQGDRMPRLLHDLEDSKTVQFCYHCTDLSVGMSLTGDFSRFKIYCGDTGLFVTLAYWDKDFTENVIYQKLLSDKLNVNLGYVYENLIAQMLVASGNRLFYYTWPRDEKHNYEIDFLLSRGAKLWPVEVKSSGYRTHASLDAFCEKFSQHIERRFMIYTKDLCKDKETTLLPVYMTPLL